MAQHAKTAGEGRATAAMFTVFTIALGVVIYVECGMVMLIPYVLFAPWFPVLLLWLTADLPEPTSERFEQARQAPAAPAAPAAPPAGLPHPVAR
jgi:hypothetical protein